MIKASRLIITAPPALGDCQSSFADETALINREARQALQSEVGRFDLLAGMRTSAAMPHGLAQFVSEADLADECSALVAQGQPHRFLWPIRISCNALAPSSVSRPAASS
jgi:hypothetical protein